MNVQFVDQNRQLIQFLLDLVDVDDEESESGAYLATILIRTIKEYNLTTRLGWITSNNAGVNNTLVRAIEAFMRAEGINYWLRKREDYVALAILSTSLHRPLYSQLIKKQLN